MGRGVRLRWHDQDRRADLPDHRADRRAGGRRPCRGGDHRERRRTVTVTETYHFTDDKPATSHRVNGTTLQLTDTGCRNDEVRCGVEFRVHLPAAARAEITAQAGAVRVTGLLGDVAVTTQAGAVEGRALGGADVAVSTQAGAANLEFARVPSTVRASTEVGAVELGLPSGASYAVDVQTTVGSSDVSVQRDPASPHKVEVRTNVGAVKVHNL